MRCKLIKPLPYTKSPHQRNNLWANAYSMWIEEVTVHPKWQVTLGPMHYKMVVHGMEPSRGYQKHPGPPRHDRYKLKRVPILADYYAHALQREGVKAVVVEHLEHGTVLEFDSIYVGSIARIIGGLNFEYELPEPSREMQSSGLGTFYWTHNIYQKRKEQEDSLLAWLADSGIETWLHVFQSCGKRYLRFFNERDLVRFRLYQG